MNKEQTYHIDTTEEEAALFVDPPVEKKPLFKMPSLPKVSVSFPKIFCVVLGAHILIAIALFGTTVKILAKEEDKKALDEPTPVPEASPSPTPNVVIQEPVPKVVRKPAPKPEAKPVQKTTPKPASETHPKTPTKSKYTETYVVKQGDTFDKIVKKFKLNGEKLQKINNIKDTNKIVVGQTLKFM